MSNIIPQKTILYLILFFTGISLIVISIIPILDARQTNRISGYDINEFSDTKGVLVNQKYRPQGHLLLSLKPKNSFDRRIEGYEFDLAKGILSKIDGDSVSTAYHTVSADRQYGALIGAPVSVLEDSSLDTLLAYQVYRVKQGEVEIAGAPLYKEAQVITHNTHSSKRLPSINNNGDILYAALAPKSEITTTEVSETKEWSMYLVRNDKAIDEEPVLMGQGVYPKWINTHVYIFSKDDGIYIQDSNDDTHQPIKIIPFIGYTALTNMKMSASKDGTLLAWSTPDTGKVFMYDISDTANARLVHTFRAHAFWSAFSPDNKYIAIQAVNWETVVDNPNPRIEIYSLETFELQYSVSIDSFIQTAMFLNDWVE